MGYDENRTFSQTQIHEQRSKWEVGDEAGVSYREPPLNEALRLPSQVNTD